MSTTAGHGDRGASREPRRFSGGAALLRRDAPLAVLVAALVVLGVWLRVQELGFPRGMSWDEHHFVDNARAYIHRAHDANDHPPFGKLLMVPSMLLLGDSGVGWRASQLVFGLLNIVLAATLSRSLFRDPRAAWLAAAFVAGDGFLIAYSRTALLDGFLTAFTLASVLACVRARSPWGFAAAGLAIGCAASIKVSGFTLGLPALLACARARRPVASAAALGVAPVVYTLQDMAGLAVAREPHSPLDAWRVTLSLVRAAAGVNDFKHPLTSHWYTWFLPKRPITLRWDTTGLGSVRVMTTLGNLLLWWAAAAALFWAASLAAAAVARRVRRRAAPRQGRVARGAVVLFGYALAMLLPWLSGVRDSYIYHYLPIYTLMLVLLSGLAAREYRRRRVAVLACTAAVLLASAFYAPVWGQLPLSRQAFEARLFVPRWR